MKRDPSRPRYSSHVPIEPQGGGLRCPGPHHMEIDGGTAKFDLYFGLDERPGTFHGRLSINDDLFDPPSQFRR